MESAQVPNDGQENVPVLVHTLKIHAGEFPFIHLGSDKGLLDARCPLKVRKMYRFSSRAVPLRIMLISF